MNIFIQLKVCQMEQVRLRYERTFTVKRLAFSKDDDWDTVQAKIASAYSVTSSLDNAYIVFSDAELDSRIGSSFPMIGSYISNVHPTGMGRAVFRLCIQDGASDSIVSNMHSHNYAKMLASFSQYNVR